MSRLRIDFGASGPLRRANTLDASSPGLSEAIQHRARLGRGSVGSLGSSVFDPSAHSPGRWAALVGAWGGLRSAAADRARSDAQRDLKVARAPLAATLALVAGQRAQAKNGAVFAAILGLATGGCANLDVPSLSPDLSPRPRTERVRVRGPGSGSTVVENCTPSPRTPIVYLGMNDGASYEVAALKRAGASVTHLGSAKNQDGLEHEGRWFDLTDADDRRAYAEALGVVGMRGRELARLINEADDYGRDEVAALARTLSEAESGARCLDRLILSGHSDGGSIWGDDNGLLTWDLIGELMALFPRASAQVRALMIAACYSGGESTFAQLRTALTGLDSMLGYDESAPGSKVGATTHLVRWAEATTPNGSRGESESSLRVDLMSGTRKGQNIAVWTRENGYQVNRVRSPLEVDESRYEATRTAIASIVEGETDATDGPNGVLRTHLNNVHHVLSHPDLPEHQRAVLEREAQRMPRLIHYDAVRRRFAETYAREIAAGYGAAGMEPAPIERLSRSEAVRSMYELDRVRVDRSRRDNANAEPIDRLYLLLRKGLLDLDPAVIPASWI
ncbi:MAG: hypothetical protein IPK13_02125 [Deltaproteobacteria bacterium]|nr:hypothetical protein [Deltaproteobacteria bacterium]